VIESSAPTVSTPGLSPQPAARPDPLAESLDRGRGENALFMNWIRVVMATTFLLLYALGILVLHQDALRPTVPHLVVYCLLATVLWACGRRSRGALGFGRFAVPLLDMPMAAWIQRTTVTHSDEAATTALYALALFVFLVVLSSFSLRARHLIVSGLVAVAGLAVVYSAADLSVLSWIAGPMLLLLTAAMMSWLPHRQNALLRQTAERQARRDRLARYFSPGVAEMIERHDTPADGEACDITVLFCDIRGFTRISEVLDPPDVVRLLNDFHSHMVEEIFRYGGTLDKYLGDGLLAYFNAPVRQANHASRGVTCALAMLDRLDSLNEARRQRHEEPLRIGIGVHSGTAVVGIIGAANRREFTAIGDTVNVASRLQSLTRDRNTSILVSEAVADALPPDEPSPFSLSPAGSAEVRGRTQGVRLFIPSWS
jgi:class 3 adenylate cyclase